MLASKSPAVHKTNETPDNKQTTNQNEKPTQSLLLLVILKYYYLE